MRGKCEPMIIITPDADVAQAEAALAAVYREIGELREVLQGLKQEVAAGEDAALEGGKKTLVSLRPLLEISMKMESQCAEFKQKWTQIARGGYALDLDAARAEIGCRLDRLRIVRCPEQVSE